MEISVIIPCYNSFYLMKRCLQSLENQTFKEFEIIIVDDCSQDGSYEKLLDYKKKNLKKVRVYRSLKNIGAGGARNIGIKYAKGKYLTFCDSDDWYEENFLELMYYNITKYKADVIMCNYKKVFENGCSKNVDYVFNFESTTPKEAYIALSKSSLCLLMVEKDLFKNLQIPNLKNGEDVAIVPVILSKSRCIVSINDFLYNYYIRNGSQSNKPDIKIQKNLLEAYEYIIDNIEEKYKLEKQFLGIKIVLYGVILNCFKAGERIENICQILNNFNIKNTGWGKNKYLSNLGIVQKVFIKLVKYRLWVLLWIVSKLHYLYTRR